MALKRRTKVNPAFSMSSMTDIVFLLLIFFMVTSTLVHPNALKLFMPRSAEQTTNPPEKFVTVRITNTGSYLVEGRQVSESELLTEINDRIGKSNKFINLVTDKGVSTKDAVVVLNLAKDNGIQIALNIR